MKYCPPLAKENFMTRWITIATGGALVLGSALAITAPANASVQVPLYTCQTGSVIDLGGVVSDVNGLTCTQSVTSAGSTGAAVITSPDIGAWTCGSYFNLGTADVNGSGCSPVNLGA
jgi:hypothetical protein